MASDPQTDWITQYAIYIKINFPNMKPEFETINELWNSNFAWSLYARNKQIAWSHMDPQILTASAPTAVGRGDTCPNPSCVLHFASVPSWITVGSIVSDLTQAQIGTGHITSAGITIVTAKDATTITLNVPVSNAGLCGGVCAGDQIGFAWSAIASSGVSLGDEFAGKQGSLMCQAVSAVYGGDKSKFDCILGAYTNAACVWGSCTTPVVSRSNLWGRIWASAYVGQNPANIPIQTGCAGPSSGPLAVMQTGCPVMQRNGPYNWATAMAVTNYLQVGEAGYGAPFQVPIEYAHAYNFWQERVSGNATAAAAIMHSYMQSANWPTQTYGQDIPIITGTTQAWYNFMTTCGGVNGIVGPSPCPMANAHILAYEGAYSNYLHAPDFSISLTGTKSFANPCVLSTQWKWTNASISGGAGFKANYITGTTLTPNTHWYSGAVLTGAGIPANTFFVNAAFDPFAYVNNDGNYSQVIGPLGPITITASPVSAVAGMSVTITGASPSGYNGTYIVQSDVQPGQIPINLDCTSLGNLTTGTITFDGSANYVSYTRLMSYYSADMPTVMGSLLNSVLHAGQLRGSQLGLSGPDPFEGASEGPVLMQDIYQYNPIGGGEGSFINGNTLTIAGKPCPVTGGTYTSATGLVSLAFGSCPTGQAKPASGPVTVATGTGVDGKFWGNVTSSTLSYYTTSGLGTITIPASGSTISQASVPGYDQAPNVITGLCEPGEYVVGLGIPAGTIVASGIAQYSGDTITLTYPAGTTKLTISSEAIVCSIRGATGVYNGIAAWNAAH